MGKDPFDREQLMYEIDFPGNTCVKSGINLALHDLLGKALDVHGMCHLIGGSRSLARCSTVSRPVAAGTPDDMVRQ